MQTKNEGRSFKQIAGVSLVLIAVFWFGWAVGAGQVNIRFSDIVSRNQQLPDDLDYSSVEEAYDILKDRYDGKLTVEQLLNGLKSGLADATGDAYTEYLDPEETERFRDDLNSSFSGIGAQLDKEGESIIIVAPIDGFPADKAGLKAKDVIVEINGEPAFNISLSEAVSKIRGPSGSEVTLKIIRDGRELEKTITRQDITIPSVKTEILEGNIGYLQISQFNEDTTSLAQEAALKFKQANVKGIIVDVRGNPGGLLNSAVDVASLWVAPDEQVLQEKRGGQVVQTFKGSGEPILRGIDTIVLINEGSASASEILAGALKDNNLAVLVGEKTFGKGSVQQIESLPGGASLKITIARWYTPAGRNIDKEGIAPDTKIELSEQDAERDRDPQKDAALKALRD